jgi:hypothetical protein
MSSFPSTADLPQHNGHLRFVPISDVPVTNSLPSRPVFSGPTKVLVVMRAPAATKLACLMKPSLRQALSALKSLRPQQGVEQVTQQAGSDEGGE